MTIFEGLTVTGLSAPILLGLTILMLLTGRLWTNSAYQEKVKESEMWRTAYETEREARKVSDEQTGELLELAKTTHEVVIALFGASERTRRSGGANVASSKE